MLSLNGYTLCGILMLISEIWKQWTLSFMINNSVYNWWYFPFQLCSIPMYVCLVIGLFSSPRIQKHIPFARIHGDDICSLLMAFLMDYGLLGGFFTFFDTSGMHYDYLPLTIHSFAWHILLIFLGCASGLNPKSNHSLRGYRFSTTLYLVCCGIATIFNLAFYRFGTINMFYISPRYSMNQKVFSHVADTLGNGFGIGFYIIASIIGAGLFHFIWSCIDAKYNRLKS